MYKYPVITNNTTAEVSRFNTNSTTTTHMPRNRSLSTTSASSPPPALLTRGFASLRRAHRRLSNSSPSSPVTPQETSTNSISPATSLSDSSSTREQDSAPAARPRIRLVPNVGLSGRSFVFEVIDRELEPGVTYRIGRFSDRNALPDKLSFKSKVVSRSHAEIWTEQGKVFIRDIGSSSGTFLNRIRLSAPSHISTPHEVKDGDAVQLGVDYQGGIEPIYRAVRIRVEINRQTQNPNSPFTRAAFQQLRSHLIGTAPAMPQQSEALVQPADLGLHREPTKVQECSNDIVAAPDSPKQLPLSDLKNRHMPTDVSRADIQECCICLYAIAPFQALFIAPCSHIFHFKCLRPIVFQNYPGFSCPLCRSYFDLEASVAVEVDEVLETLHSAKEQQQKQRKQQQSPVPLIDTVPELNEEEEEGEEQDQPHVEGSLRQSSSNHSELSSEVGCEVEEARANETIKNRLESPAPVASAVTPPVPYISVPEDNDEVPTSHAPSSSASSPSQPINMAGDNQLQAHPRLGRTGETLLSSTLVGSPTFDTNVVPTSTDSNA